MCGLVGVVCKRPNGFTQDHKDIFSTLLFVDTLRGKDSTGVFVIKNDGDVFVAKDKGMAPEFMQSKEYETALQRAWNSGSAMVGHNRAATRGVVNDHNAHPFNVEDKILLVHNGTMRSDHKKHADVEVDSHAIAHLINDKESVAEALGSFYGAYALIWYDIEKAELNMIRNDERTLYWMELDDAWVWSSERSMLLFAANRVGVKIKSEPTLLPIDTLQKFQLQPNKSWKAWDEKVEIKKQVYESEYTGMGMANHRHHDAGGDGLDGSWGYDDINWTTESPPFRQGPTMLAREWADARRDHNWRAAHDAANEQRRREAINISEGRHPLHGYPGGGSRSSGLEGEPMGKPAKDFLSHVEPYPFMGTEERERAMAAKLNKRITHKHYSNIVLPQHPFNSTVHCAPFEYALANGKDSKDGFYLYASPFDDDDIILRKWFSAKAVTEERILQLAGCEYVYEFTLGKRQWFPFHPEDMKTKAAAELDDMDGYVIVTASEAKMISSGKVNSEVHN